MVHSAEGEYGALMYQVWDNLIVFDDPEAFQRNFQAAPVAPRTLFAAHWCQSEVSNGGFHQFFWNSTGGLAPEAETAFRNMGMPRVADVVSRARRLFPEPYPRDWIRRQDELERIDRTALSRLDDEFYELVGKEGGGFVSAADAYALRQTGFFRSNGRTGDNDA